MDKASVFGTEDSRFDPCVGITILFFFTFTGHGATPRVVSYVLAKFHIDPSSVEASGGLKASIDACQKLLQTTFPGWGHVEH